MMTTKKKEEEYITICEWHNYNSKRCTARSNGEKFCRKHKILIEEYELITNNNGEEDEDECSTEKEIKFIPRNKNHLKLILEKFNYESLTVDAIVTPGNCVEVANISEDDYIELDDGTKYYYETTEKNCKKAKNLKVILIDHCPEEPVVKFLDETFCEECFIKKSKKICGPTLGTIKKNIIKNEK